MTPGIRANTLHHEINKKNYLLGSRWFVRISFGGRLMNVTRQDIEAGQAVYTPKMLGFYDFLILRVIVPYIWKCPIGSRITLYNANITSNHLEVGVGSGFYLENTIFPNSHPRLALMDLNPNCLKYTSDRLSKYGPETYRVNILEPIDLDIDKFDSIALNAVIHCFREPCRAN